ncbi:phosphoglycerate mutase-like protein [Basidiobolus meristosporus CBS 931.73]|uniref:Phosphoglycerate mutase-like protein n=1 Tax=Basidiobolus meristosporus CBS 931.73 TaxID=1314790 RepID=A0A1Y1ZAC9_9FUNG|nr:phosphoglycerate mutase-like protein [Basidiobolus meristosporus CBS 931.73]|eukprot:ORY07208.1 phosphoglycerate mutase-like protein [Basidiobolus meristosporus CBS 931.73]
MNQPSCDFPKLKKTYYGLRHGFSKANELNLIVSDPRNGCEDFGLTELGVRQARKAAEEFLPAFTERSVKVYTSDFLRTRETCTNFVDRLNELAPGLAVSVVITPLLRERYFGELEKQSANNYQNVWELDEKALPDTQYHSESVHGVLNRAIQLINEIESKHDDPESIVFVSHGDALQILQTGFSGIRPEDHRTLPHWSQGEIKKFTRN